MRRFFLFVLTVSLLQACGNNNDNNNRDEPDMKPPTATQPPSDAIPDSIKINNDSVLVPIDSPNRGKVTTHQQAPKEQ